MNQALIDILTISNITINTAIAMIAVSMLLYNLVRNMNDRVTRASSVLLGCVSLAFIMDSLASLDSPPALIEVWLRIQWIGIAFIPAATFHLADALLVTTGLVSRWRRRLGVRLLYLVSGLITLQAAFGKMIITELVSEPLYHMRRGNLFAFYAAYFIVANVISMRVVWRARERCLTPTTRRRMTYLFIVLLSPGLGIFPYSLLFESFARDEGVPLLPALVIFNLANFFIVVMLIFMSYPLSFFGNNKPDRVVKAELFHFLLRGPFTATVLIAVMVVLPRVSERAGISDNSLLIAGVIGSLLAMQWGITQALPLLENRLIYSNDHQEARQLHEISERLLTRADIHQLEEAILAAICDQLRVTSAFIARFDSNGVHLEQTVGEVPVDEILKMLTGDLHEALALEPTEKNAAYGELKRRGEMFTWRSFWLFPLWREAPNGHVDSLVGILGIWAQRDLDTTSREEYRLLQVSKERATKVLIDLQLQEQVLEQLSLFVKEMDELHFLPNITRYGQFEFVPEFIVSLEDVRGALRDYWGGPKLSDSDLLRLRIVQVEMDKHDGNPTRALQSILSRAIESLKPDSEQDLSAPEWILYNILDMRYLQGKKVREVARQLYMSEPDLYRKQRIAIEEIARSISEMERSQIEGHNSENH